MDTQELHRLLSSEKLTHAVGHAVMKKILRAALRAEGRHGSASRHPASSVMDDAELVTLTAEDRLTWLLEKFERRWVCTVVRSGFHNGAKCTPDEPHGGDWACTWRWEAMLTDAQRNLVAGATSPGD